jgi:hypothetical protein
MGYWELIPDIKAYWDAQAKPAVHPIFNELLHTIIANH